MTRPTLAYCKPPPRGVWSMDCPNCNRTAPLHGYFADTGIQPQAGEYNCFYCKNNVYVDKINLLDPEYKEDG